MGKQTGASNRGASTREKAIQKIAEDIEGINVAMVTTIGEDGELHSRPMTAQRMRFDGDLWFLTAANSGKAMELANDPHINVAFADPKTHRYVSISGHAHVELDKRKVQELWRLRYRAWFPDGLSDPELALIKVTPVSAQYWDASNSRFVQLIGQLRAMATGRAWVQNGRLDLHKPGPQAV